MAHGREAQRWMKQGADAEFARLEPRNRKLKEAVAVREKTIASLNKEVRALRIEMDRLKATVKGPSLDDNTLAALEDSARADADVISGLRASARADAVEINALRQAAERDEAERQKWMRWAWVGQPESEDSDDAVYQVKIAMLERAVAYWERRARNECPACTQAVIDMDAAADFSTRHLRLDDILHLMETM